MYKMGFMLRFSPYNSNFYHLFIDLGYFSFCWRYYAEATCFL